MKRTATETFNMLHEAHGGNILSGIHVYG